MQHRRARCGMHGPVCVSLVWTDATADLDVCATTPASGEIALENRNAGGGLLYVDDCAHFGKVPSFHCTDSASTHVENVYFDEQPAAGDYTIRVENHHSTASEAVPHTLTIRVDPGAQRPAWELLLHWAIGAASHSSIATRQLPCVQRQKRRATYGRTPTASSGFRPLKPSNPQTLETGDRHALDNRCNTAGIVGSRPRYCLHDGRSDSHLDRRCDRDGVDPLVPGAWCLTPTALGLGLAGELPASGIKQTRAWFPAPNVATGTRRHPRSAF